MQGSLCAEKGNLVFLIQISFRFPFYLCRKLKEYMQVTRFIVCLAAGLSGFGARAFSENRNAPSHAERSLPYYIEEAMRNSPLLQDYRNQQRIQQSEEERLKAFYTQAKVELSGEYLFVPVVSTANGKTSFQWNAQDGTDYWGYDLGQSSGHLLMGATWTKPLLGNGLYKVAQEQTRAVRRSLEYRSKLEKHQLERAVTEQYILCLLDRAQMDYADSISRILERQSAITGRLIKAGYAKVSDFHLLNIEQENNNDLRASSWQSYRSHLSDLNILCGIKDTACYTLVTVDVSLKLLSSSQSAFIEQYHADSLQTVAGLHNLELQYKPQLNVFANAGLQVGSFHAFEKHFGMSGGLSFSWLLFDGKQRRYKEQQAKAQLNSISIYKSNFLLQNALRKSQYRKQMQAYDERQAALKKLLNEYDRLLTDYRKEIAAGQMSLLDYITVLRNKIQTEKDYLLLHTNRQLLVVAFNYWNW